MVCAEGVELVKGEEGLRLIAYKCPAGVWTIGYGHTGGVREGQQMTQAEAIETLMQDLAAVEAKIVGLLARPANKYQLAAMVSLTFNIGAQAFATSTVLKAHNRGDFMSAGRAFNLWTKARVEGKLVDLPGLIRRRAKESALYMRAVEVHALMGQPVMMTPPQEMPQMVEQQRATPLTSPAVLGPSIAAGAGGLATVADTLNQVSGAAWSVQPIFELARYAPIALAIVAVAAVAWAIWHYYKRRREGRV